MPDPYRGLRLGAASDEFQHLGGVDRRVGVRARNDGGYAPCHCRPARGPEAFNMARARLPHLHAHVHDPRRQAPARAIDHPAPALMRALRHVFGQHLGDRRAFDTDRPRIVHPRFGVDQPCIDKPKRHRRPTLSVPRQNLKPTLPRLAPKTAPTRPERPMGVRPTFAASSCQEYPSHQRPHGRSPSTRARPVKPPPVSHAGRGSAGWSPPHPRPPPHA